MRVLFVSNYFPPRVYGGYEQWCHEVACELVARGHQVCVLTSGACEPENQSLVDNGLRVRRVLHLEVEVGLIRTTLRRLVSRQRMEEANLKYVRDIVATERPEAALIWGMWNVPRSVPARLEDLLESRVAYYLCDYWPTLPSAYLQQWQAPSRNRLANVPKQAMRWLVPDGLTRQPRANLRFEHPICVSRAVRDLLLNAGVAVDHAQVIYGGVNVQEFGACNRHRGSHPGSRGLRMVCAGRLTPDKGVHTAIHGLARLAVENDQPVTLDIVGMGNPGYERELKQLAVRYGLGERVRFRRGVSRSAMPHLLSEYDVLIHGSEWQEPFPRVVLEAMAAELVVIGTTTGGTGAALEEDRTGLTFAPGDAEGLAKQLRRLVHSEELRRRLTKTARSRVEECFTFTRMVDEIEAALLQLARQPEWAFVAP